MLRLVAKVLMLVTLTLVTGMQILVSVMPTSAIATLKLITVVLMSVAVLLTLVRVAPVLVTAMQILLTVLGVLAHLQYRAQLLSLSLDRH